MQPACPIGRAAPDHGDGANLTAVAASESVEDSFPPIRRTDPSARAMVMPPWRPVGINGRLDHAPVAGS
jgi:hypothetical protein